MKRNNIKPVFTYFNPYEIRKEIYKDLRNQAGIYLWTNLDSDKKYVGSSINLSRRLRDYFRKSYLKLELKTNNSLIYKALIKYDYNNFRLDILELCDSKFIVEREQFYLDNLDLEYNTLKVARSNLGFKHNESTKERLRMVNLGKIVSMETRIKLYSNSQAFEVQVENLSTKEITLLPSIRRAALFVNVHHSYISECLSKKGFYKGKNYYIIRNVDI